MPCLSGNYDRAAGILVNVGILPHQQFAAIQQAGLAASPQTPLGQLPIFTGLLDTGASVTCISDKVIKAVGLQPSGKTMMSGSTGQSSVDQYSFCVVFMFGLQQTPTGQFTGQVNVRLVQGCEFTSHGFGFDVLIGRDILCQGALMLSFDGHYTISF